MPINDVAALRTHILKRIEAGGVLSIRDVRAIVSDAKKNGVTPEEVETTVATLVEAMTTKGWDPRGGVQEKRIEALLGALHAARPDALDISGFVQAGKVNWLDFVVARASGGAPAPTNPTGPTVPLPGPAPGPAPAGAATSLPKGGFGGEAIAIDSAGALVAGGRALPLVFPGASSELRAALASLTRPGQLDALDGAQAGALGGALSAAVAGAGLPLAGDDPQKFEAASAVFFALGGLAEIAGKLGAADVERLLQVFDKLPSPAAQAVCLRALEGAPKTDAQKQALVALPAIADKDVLLSTFDAMRGETATIGSTWSPDKLTGPAAGAALTALAFAKNAAAVDSIKKGLEEYAKINMPSFSVSGGIDAQEAKAVADFLAPYVNNASTTQLVFGAFLNDAPREVAKHTNARVQAQLAPLLDGPSPKLGGVPLSGEQAAVVKQLLPGIKDEGALQSLGRALLSAHGAFSSTINTQGTSSVPAQPLSPAAFAVFSRAALAALDAKKDMKDGMIDMSALTRDVSADAKAVGDSVLPHLRTLSMAPPKMGAVVVSPALAGALKTLLLERTRSPLSGPNLLGGLEVVAQKNGGKVEGAAADAFLKIVDDYIAEFPGAKLLDFNKLGRVASFRIEGKQVPLCTLNGQAVPLADFYTKVAVGVAASIDKSDLRHAWMADRFGWRAKCSVELLDVIAQQTAEQAGPVHVLRQQFPGATIEILATAKDGEHERFLYRVQGQGVFCEQSDGLVTRYDERLRTVHPILFTATVRDDGAFDVQVPPLRKINKYPLQTPFSVGDSVDVQFFDSQAQDKAVEGQPFETRYKVLHGTIKSYDAAGNYVVAFKDPQGREQQKSFTIDELMKQNVPHYFSENASLFSDVSINVRTDAQLKAFLDGAEPIIRKHLPTDGSLLSLSTDELAKRQKACVDELMKYARDRVKYPTDKNASPDEKSRFYHEAIGDGWGRVDLGYLVQIERGVCRHQCIVQHLLLQRAGIDSRLASGAANTPSGDFRGFHIWVELSLADNARYLSDQTWNDVSIPLWDGAYGTDKRRIEMYDRTARYDRNLGG
jgi:hypothetical protein